MLKRWIRSRWGAYLLSWLLVIIIVSVMVTIRWRTLDRRHVNALMKQHEGFILVFWHERILAIPLVWPFLPRRNKIHALQSPHADGRFMAQWCRNLGVHTIWGSSNRNALSGLRGLKRILDAGKVAAITPDGPRGPARIAAMGPVSLSNLSGKPIIPATWAVSRYWRAPGWDGMVIPKPFSRGIFIVGDPIDPQPNADKDDRERQRQLVEKTMNELTDLADSYFTLIEGTKVKR